MPLSTGISSYSYLQHQHIFVTDSNVMLHKRLYLNTRMHFHYINVLHYASGTDVTLAMHAAAQSSISRDRYTLSTRCFPI